MRECPLLEARVDYVRFVRELKTPGLPLNQLPLHSSPRQALHQGQGRFASVHQMHRACVCNRRREAHPFLLLVDLWQRCMLTAQLHRLVNP